MAYEVVINIETEQDVDDAILWYEEQQKDLGVRFYSCLLEKLEKLRNTPQYYSFVNAEYGRIAIDPFPFSIIFKIIDSSVLVLAVFHHSRNPAELIKRMNK